MRRQRVLVPVIGLVLGTAGVSHTPVWAQQADIPTSPSAPASVLDIIPYDAMRRGPLLLLPSPGMRFIRPDVRANLNSLPTLAEALGMKVVPIGSITVLAPPTMYVFEDHPGKPDPLAGLNAGERLKMLLSQFNAAQWQMAGSARGIGAQDLNDQQRPLFLSLLPDHIEVQQVKMVPGDKPLSTVYQYQGQPQTFDPNVARLRLVRSLQIGFSKQGMEDYGYSSDIQPALNEEHTILRTATQTQGDVPSDPTVEKAFGVAVKRAVPSRLKPSQIDFAAPPLQAQVPLDGAIKTLGDLLARVAQATHLELIADKRIATRALLLRTAPGQSAKAGDILQALCWSVTGAFRHISGSTFLLTDDVRGIGVLFGRLEEWGEEADLARYKMQHDLLDAAHKINPLARIGFAPDDSQALPPALLQRVDDAYQKSRYNSGPEFKLNELPPVLQKTLEAHVEWWATENVTVRTDRVRVDTRLAAQFVLPGGTTFTAPFSENINRQYLQELAAPPAARTPVPAASANPRPLPMPASLRKRVLLARLPAPEGANNGDKANDGNTLSANGKGRDKATEKDLFALLAAAKLKGFTEIWLHVMLDDPKAAERLKAAVAAGKNMGISVGGTISLLHGGGLSGPEDINLFGETGTQFAQRKSAHAPDAELRDYYAGFGGWTTLNPEEATRRLLLLARVPGLCAFTLKATVAPGWAGHTRGGDGIPFNGHLGYSVENRLACIRALGFDPLDVAPYGYSLQMDARLPFFPIQQEDGFWEGLSDFRLQQNKQALAAIYTALQQAAPHLPLYMDDRASAYTQPNTKWHGRWDAGNRPLYNPVYAGEGEGHEAAFATSSEPLLNRTGWYGNPDQLARAFGRTAQQAAKNWRGVTLDLTRLTPTQSLRMLDGLPNADTRPR